MRRGGELIKLRSKMKEESDGEQQVLLRLENGRVRVRGEGVTEVTERRVRVRDQGSLRPLDACLWHGMVWPGGWRLLTGRPRGPRSPLCPASPRAPFRPCNPGSP